MKKDTLLLLDGHSRIFFITSAKRKECSMCALIIVESSNTDLNSAWMAMGLRSVFDESTIVSVNRMSIQWMRL